MKKIWLILFLALLFRFSISFLVWHGDVNNHLDWGIRFWEYGPKEFYSDNVWSFLWPNQPPGTMYLFAGIRKLFEFLFSVFWFLNLKVPAFPSNIMFFLETNLYPALLKLPSILADLGIAYLIYRFLKDIKKEKLGILGATVFLLNPVIWYNSALWGQTDSVVNFFALLAFFLLLKRKLLLATLSLIFSFYIKASLLIFVPIFVIVAVRQKYKVAEVVKAVSLPLVIIGFLTLPFSGANPFGWLWDIYAKKVFAEQLQIITANAFNIWAFVAGIHAKSQTLLLGSLSYKLWGRLLFGASLIPTLYLVWRKQDLKSVFWSLSAISFSSFMLLTNMHERYLYPFFPVFTVVAVLDKRLLSLYWAVSGISLLNLYNFWWVPKVSQLINFLSAKDRLLPRILGFVNFGLYVFFMSKVLRLLKGKMV